MTRTERLVEASRERARMRANVLQSGLGQLLAELNKPEFKRLRLELDKLKTRQITLLDEGIAADILTEADYRRFMGDYIDKISLAELLAAL